MKTASRADDLGLDSEAIFRSEQATLRALGVDLADDHLDGYIYKPNRFKEADRQNVKPWEVSLSDQMDSMLGKLVPSQTPEDWKHTDFLFEVREGIAYCTMNRPAANNAMNDTLSLGWRDAIAYLKGRPDIRIAVLTGNGRMFCAGGDPKSFQAAQAAAGAISQGGEAQGPAVPDAGAIAGTAAGIEFTTTQRGKDSMAANMARDFFEWATLPQFTIALLNGSAMGGGVGMLCCCDMVVGVKTAHVTLSEVKLGVIPAMISPYVIRTIGAANAKKLFVTAENCSMQQAKEYGMVQRIVNDVSEFPAVVDEIAQKIRACAPGAVTRAKRAIVNCLNQPTSDSLIGYTAKEYVEARLGEECQEGMRALSTKTKPRWVEAAIDVRDT